MTLNVKSNYKY